MLLGEDVLVVADPEFNGVDQTVGHAPTRLLVEPDPGEIVDPCVQLEVRVAVSRHHRLGLRQEESPKARALVVWLNKQVDELVAEHGEVADRYAIDDGYARRELGSGSEPTTQLPSHPFKVGCLKLAGK